MPNDLQFGFSVEEPTDEQHPLTKSREAGLGSTTDLIAMLSDIHQASFFNTILHFHLLESLGLASNPISSFK